MNVWISNFSRLGQIQAPMSIQALLFWEQFSHRLCRLDLPATVALSTMRTYDLLDTRSLDSCAQVFRSGC